jgi:1,6-anhydro-N-acetylmuramate kinase
MSWIMLVAGRIGIMSATSFQTGAAATVAFAATVASAASVRASVPYGIALMPRCVRIVCEAQARHQDSEQTDCNDV